MTLRILTSFFYFVVICSLAGAKHFPSIKNLKDHCDDTVYVDGDVIIKIYKFSQKKSCQVTIMPQNGGDLVASFLSYDINDVRSLVGLVAHCSEYMQLTSSSNDNLLEDGRYCKMYKPSGHYDLGKKGTFEYCTKDWHLFTSLRTELLVTEVFKKASSSEKCPTSKFDCERSNICIDDSLTCNGYDDCGNDRDEIEGCGLTTGIIVGIVIGAAAVVAIIVVIVVLVVRKLQQ